MIETIKVKRSMITAKSTPGAVLCRERIIVDTLGGIAMAAEQYPELALC